MINSAIAIGIGQHPRNRQMFPKPNEIPIVAQTKVSHKDRC